MENKIVVPGGVVVPKNETVQIGFDLNKDGSIASDMTINVSCPLSVFQLAGLFAALAQSTIVKAEAATVMQLQAALEKHGR